MTGAIENCKVTKCYDQNCLETFLLLSMLQMKIHVSGKKCAFGWKSLAVLKNYQ